MNTPRTTLAVIGAGPAGLAAGIQAHRMGLKVLLLEENRPGGVLATAFLVENYPGFPGGIAGRELAGRMARQAEDLGVPIRKARVRRVLPGREGFLLGTDQGEVRARAVIVATGGRPRTPDLPGWEDLEGRLLFFQADELLESGPAERVLVLGGGDVAFDQAALLASLGKEVLLACRSPRPRALGKIVSLAEAQGVRVLPETRLHSLEREGKGLVAFLSSPAGEKRVPVDRVLPALGKEPDLSLLPREALEPDGALPRDSSGKTRIPGLFAAGDLRRGLDRQAVIAAGDGMAAALEAARYLEGSSR